jgi:hypothetical protein
MTRSRFLRVALPVLLACAGCGGGSPFGPPPDGNGGATGASSSTTAGTSTASSSSGAGGAQVPDCNAHDTSIMGTLDGQAVSAKVTFGIGSQQIVIVMFLGETGLLVIPTLITDSTPHPVALLRMPDGGPLGGVWYGFGAGSQLPTDLGAMGPGDGFLLTSAVRLGTCPGSALSGEVTYCNDTTGSNGCSGAESSTTVTLDGMPVGWSTAEPDGIVGFGMFADLFWQNNAFIVTRQSGMQVNGILSMPLEVGTTYQGPYAGDILCVGAADIEDPTATFGDLSFLTSFAAAPSVPGTIVGCF